MEFEHIDRVTIVPHSWVVPLLAVGVLAMMWSCVQGLRALNGKPVPNPPVLLAIAACVVAMWLVLVKLDKDWADAAVAGLLAMLAVNLGNWVLRGARKKA